MSKASEFLGDYFYPAMGIVRHRRQWYRRESAKYRLHPVIDHLADEYDAIPHDWHQLLLEYPHRSVDDFNRVAYTRDERAGEADKQTVTSLGKYLSRHYPQLADHIIRDVVALFTCSGEFSVLRELDAMVDAVMRGPRSCMSASFNLHCADGVRRHPYEVYDPKLGWGMAIRKDNDSIDGRALVFHADNVIKGFVRSYKRMESGGYSGADEALEAWLKSQGYDKWGAWDYCVETVIRHHPLCDNGFLAPYIDGGSQTVDMRRDGTLAITDGGEYDCNNTDGRSGETGEECEECGDRTHEDDMYWVSRHEDRHVCQHCCDDYYTYVYGRRGNQYYVHNDNVVCVGNEYYDVDYLSDNNIVELDDGEYEYVDNAVCLADGSWRHCDDSDVVRCEDDDEYRLKDDGCWQCAKSNNWYSDSVDYVEVDGETYHPDHAPETEKEEGESNE